MEKFSVNQLAKLAGVSVRTLHHYDEIGLLKPSLRGENKYRFYGKNELVRLQQILLYKELDIPLIQIGEILDAPGFDVMSALQQHKLALEKQVNKVKQLLLTIDNTIVQLKNKTEKMNYEDMYKGFSKEQAEAYEKEATERWGDAVKESKERMKQMSKAEWEALMQEGEHINRELVSLMHLPVSDDAVQALVKRHFGMTGKHYTVTPEMYKGLAEMYLADERFTVYYDKHKPGLAAFLSKAMIEFVKQL
ncbi:MAG: MerR family transcriptional regulator [Bacteroidota bacterium]